MVRTIVLTLLVGALMACSNVRVTDYADKKPLFEVEQFFSGDLTAHGVVKDRGGRVIRHFNADIAATWVDGVGTLVEDDPEARMLSDKLTELGGVPEIHEISQEALDAVAEAAPEADAPPLA